MNIWLIIGIALGLSMDAFAVAVATGLTLPKLTNRHIFRLAFHFGLFQCLMPIIGWYTGRTVSGHIQRYDHWIVFSLLAFIGGKMLWEAVHRHPSERKTTDPTRGLSLITLSVATSLDALAVGLSLALLQVSIWLPSIIIGIIAGTLTAIGIIFGSRLGDRFGHWAEIIGGIVLIGIGTHTLISHLAT
ncbi:MAG: manganese efflux pump MntP family protein [Phycisphaerales bacterium]|nr:manganese efflux pump MntP family protein [Phycisphaerales bacterium]